MSFKFVVERMQNNITVHIQAQTIVEAQSILAFIPKVERGGVYPLYTVEDLLPQVISDEDEKGDI